MTTCARCSGIGTIECPDCGGRGRVRPADWLPGIEDVLSGPGKDPAAADRCPGCAGSGRVACPDCASAGEVDDNDD